jgi:hypothetical protein
MCLFLQCPASTQVECQQPASSPATATDACGGTPLVTCSPASGSGLPAGQSTVTCTAMDAAGNRASCSFPVVVVDTQPPTLELVGAPSVRNHAEGPAHGGCG